ncbi:saccharopine dehydrogenase NADP-binding domain-containing protein [soil metagenome]
MSSARTYDLVVLGATGFTARLATAHLARFGPAGLRWALAGRSLERLQQARAELATRDPRLADLPIEVVELTDDAALADMAGVTSVLINATGPYLMHGEPVVRACAETGTDYVDLTGEPEFVDRMYALHHATAVRTGARLVHACGFDSVPHDLGALHAVRQVPAEHRTGAIALRGIVRATGGVSGGTLASMLNAVSRLKPMREAAAERGRLEAQPTGRTSQPVTGRPHRDPVTGTWLLPLPAIDQQIVARSGAAVDDFGPKLTYSHYAGIKRLPVLVGALAGVGLGIGAAQIGPVRRAISARLPQGTGPDDATREAASFTVDFVADHAGGTTHTQVTGPDPYDLSGIALAESALCLAFDHNPGVVGQVTTAQAMGDHLTSRLGRYGVRFSVVGG